MGVVAETIDHARLLRAQQRMKMTYPPASWGASYGVTLGFLKNRTPWNPRGQRILRRFAPQERQWPGRLTPQGLFFQSLRQVLAEVLEVFEPDGQPDEVVSDAALLPDFTGHGSMAHRGRLFSEGGGTAQRLRQ